MTTHQPLVEIDWTEEAGRLSAAVAADAKWYTAVASELVRPTDRLAVDIGCGGAGMAEALSAVLPRAAFVVGMDGNGDVLDAARQRILERGIDDGHIRLIQADLDTDLAVLPEVISCADIIWASASIHHLADQQAAIDALAALLGPGGRLAIAEGGLPARYLPGEIGIGEPGLEVRLMAADDLWFSQMRAGIPGNVPMPYGWTTALGRAGLMDVTTQTFLFEHPAPLGDTELTRVLDALAHRVGRAKEAGLLSTDDEHVWTRLLDAADPVWLGRRDDIYSLSTRSVHVGYRPRASL